VCAQYVEAVEEYRSMLRSVDEHSDEVRTDPLQVLHIVHNLNDILSLKPAGVGHTLNDSQLKDQVNSLKLFEVCFLQYTGWAKKNWTIFES